MKKNSNSHHHTVNKLPKWGVIILLVALVIGLQPPATIYAATITVSSGSGDNLTANDGICTLREAIANANLVAGGNITSGDCADGDIGTDTITLPSGTYLLDLIAEGDLDITDDLIINGAGAAGTIIDGNLTDRVIHTHGSANVDLNNLTIQRGQIGTIATNSGNGGGIYHESNGIMNLSHVDILNNLAGHRGGGLENTGTATLTNCNISENESRWGGGLVSVAGTAITTINNSTVSNNTADTNGGGLNIYDGSMIVENSTFTGNNGPGNGGGMATRGTLTVNNSTISDNSTTGNGDGIYTYEGGTATVSNSIVANNSTDNCSGNIVNNGNNLEDTGSTCSGFTQGDPLLGALADNGGPTETHALLVGSPAIDAGDCSGGSNIDQRSATRPTNTTCDIGAFELQSDEIAEEDCTAPFNLSNVNVSATLNSGTPGCFSATKRSVFPGSIQTNGEFEITWRLSTVNPTFDINLRLCYTAAELTTANITDESTIVAYRWDESTHAWVPQTTSPDALNNCVDVANVTELSPWTLAGDGNAPTTVSLQSITTANPSTGWVILLFSILMLTAGGLWLQRTKH